MEVIDLSQKEYEKLIPYFADENAINCDANFYYPRKDKTILYKLFRTNNPTVLSEKRKIVEELIEAKDDINIPELILPKDIVTINNSFKGITIDKVTGCNISLFLSSQECPIKIKIELLKQLGDLLKRIHNVNPKYNLAFGDVHGDNFMSSKDSVYGIDTDGMKIGNNKARGSYYTHKNSWIKEISKYELDDSGFVEITKDTDLFCFIMMILEVISDEKAYLMSLDEYQKHLEHLDNLGFNSDLLNACASLYNPNVSNINPTDYLDSIITIKNGSYSLFKR